MAEAPDMRASARGSRGCEPAAFARTIQTRVEAPEPQAIPPGTGSCGRVRLQPDDALDLRLLLLDRKGALSECEAPCERRDFHLRKWLSDDSESEEFEVSKSLSVEESVEVEESWARRELSRREDRRLDLV